MPSFVGLCLLIKLIKHTKETSWNGPLAYQWIENIVCETFISYSSVCCLHGAGFPLVLILFFRWRVVGLQCCVSFRYLAKWMSYVSTHCFVIWTITKHWVEFPALCRVLVLCFMYAKLFQSCPTLCKTMDCSPPVSSVHGILQAGILEWVAISYSHLFYV